jgi:hypothetical protein
VVDEMHRKVQAITGDPLPYGIEPNRTMLEETIATASPRASSRAGRGRRSLSRLRLAAVA